MFGKNWLRCGEVCITSSGKRFTHVRRLTTSSWLLKKCIIFSICFRTICHIDFFLSFQKIVYSGNSSSPWLHIIISDHGYKYVLSDNTGHWIMMRVPFFETMYFTHKWKGDWTLYFFFCRTYGENLKET